MEEIKNKHILSERHTGYLTWLISNHLRLKLLTQAVHCPSSLWASESHIL